jgi:lipoprotein-releasing system permease protein
VKAAAPFIPLQALLGRGDVLRGVLLRGIDPAREGAVSALAQRQGRRCWARCSPARARSCWGANWPACWR